MYNARNYWYNTEMHIYDDVDTMWVDLMRTLLRSRNSISSRDGAVAGEILGYHGVLDASQQRTLLMSDARRLDPCYAAAELLWYFGSTGSVEQMAHYAPSYRKFDGYGAYGPRIMGKLDSLGALNPLKCAIKILKDSPDSRQAIVGIWRPHDVLTAWAKDSNDIPCTLTHQYLLRDDELHMIVNMRSNDAWLGFPYDVFAFTCMQRVVAAELGVDVGQYHHVAGSMHLYERNAGDEPRPTSTNSGHGWRCDTKYGDMMYAVQAEAMIRRGVVKEVHAASDMARDLLCACAAHKFVDSPSPKSGVFNVLIDRRRRSRKPDASAGAQ